MKETELWRDAYHIAWIGASNPSGVRHTLVKHLATYGSSHPAVRAIAGHLDYLNGVGLGPELEDLELVKSTYQAIEERS